MAHHDFRLCNRKLALSRYSAPSRMVYASEFICRSDTDAHPPYMPIRYFLHIAAMPNLAVIHVSGSYLVIACEVNVAFCCVMAFICKISGLYAHVAFYLCDIHQICVQYSLS